MRKFNYYMAAFVFAAGVSASLSSCIDTEEPDGIKELRSAKAGYINAETALKNADVAYREAETAGQLALNANQLLENRIKEVEAKTAELNYALREASQEDSISIATTKAKTALENAKKDLAVAISNNDYAVKQAAQKNAELIALLGVTPAVANQGIIYELEDAAEDLYGDGTTTNMGTIYKLADAQKKLALAITKNYQTSESTLKGDVALQEVLVALAEQNVEDVKAIYAEEGDAAKWIEKYNSLQDEIDALDAALLQARTDSAIAKNALKAADDKIEAALKAYNDSVSKPSFVASDKLESAIGSTFTTTVDNYAATPQKFKFEYDAATKSYVLNGEVKNSDLSQVLDEFGKNFETYANNVARAAEYAAYVAAKKNMEDNAKYADDTDYKNFVDAYNDYNAQKTEANREALQTKSTAYFGSPVYIIPTYADYLVSVDAGDAWASATTVKMVAYFAGKKTAEDALATYEDEYGKGNDLYQKVQREISINDKKKKAYEDAEDQAKAAKTYTDLVDAYNAAIDAKTAATTEQGYKQGVQKLITKAYFTKDLGKKLGANATGKIDFAEGTANFSVATDDFEEQKTKAIHNANVDLTTAQDNLAKAQALLKSFQDGTYDAAVLSQNEIKTAEENVAAATRANELAQKRYDDALAAYKAAFQQ